MTTKTFLGQLPSVLASELHSLRVSSDPSSRFLYENFVPTVVQLIEHGEPIHGLTHSENAIQKADRVSIVFERRSAASTPSLQDRGVADSRRSPLEEILIAYREAAKGRQFVGLKWFRDAWIPSQAFGWASDGERVRTLLAEAIDTGLLRKEQIPNPNKPDYPTTVLREGVAGGPSERQVRRRFAPLNIPNARLGEGVIEGRQ